MYGDLSACQVFVLKRVLWRLERWLSTTEHLSLLPRIWVWSPEPTWCLTTVTPGPDDCKCSGTNNAITRRPTELLRENFLKIWKVQTKLRCE